MGLLTRAGCFFITVCIVTCCAVNAYAFSYSDSSIQDSSITIPASSTQSIEDETVPSQPGDESTDPGTGDAGTTGSDTQDPGSQDPGTQDPGTQDPGTQDPGTQDPGTQDPDIPEPGTDPGENTPDTPSKPALPPPAKPGDDESLWYSRKISMKKEHQKLLWDYCKKRKLDYIDMLTVIYTESNFNEKSSHGKYKGYFQISSSHGSSLSKTLKTKNNPLDGSININWGTAMFSWIMADKRVQNLEGKKKRDAAISIYHRGTGGYDRYGVSSSYLKTFYKKRDIICSYFKKDK